MSYDFLSVFIPISLSLSLFRSDRNETKEQTHAEREQKYSVPIFFIGIIELATEFLSIAQSKSARLFELIVREIDRFVHCSRVSTIHFIMSLPGKTDFGVLCLFVCHFYQWCSHSFLFPRLKQQQWQRRRRWQNNFPCHQESFDVPYYLFGDNICFVVNAIKAFRCVSMPINHVIDSKAQ